MRGLAFGNPGLSYSAGEFEAGFLDQVPALGCKGLRDGASSKAFGVMGLWALEGLRVGSESFSFRGPERFRA